VSFASAYADWNDDPSELNIERPASVRAAKNPPAPTAAITTAAIA
jgi:hypothetical protein